MGVHVSPRRIAAIATGLPAERAAKRAEVRGPKADAPEQARAGFARKHGLEVGDLVERDGLMWAISDGAATPVAELVPELAAQLTGALNFFQVDAVGSWPLLSSRAVAGGQARRSGGAGGAVRPGRDRRVARPPVPGRRGGGGEPPPGYRSDMRSAHVMVAAVERRE